MIEQILVQLSQGAAVDSSMPVSMFEEGLKERGYSDAHLSFLLGHNFGYVEHDQNRVSCIFAVRRAGDSVVLNAWQPDLFGDTSVLPELNDPNFAKWVLSRFKRGAEVQDNPAPIESPYVVALGGNLASAGTYFVSWPKRDCNFLLVTRPGGKNPQLSWRFFGDEPYLRLGTGSENVRYPYRPPAPMNLADLRALMASEGVGLTPLSDVLRGKLPDHLVVAEF